MADIRFSLGVPNCREGKAHPHGVVGADWMGPIARTADELGYNSLWLNELLQHQLAAQSRSDDPMASANFNSPANYFDPITIMSYMAAVTSRVRFTTATIILPHHHPVVLSRQIATLDHLSSGRVTLGVGLGGSADSFHALRGDLGAVNRGRMMDEYIDALRAQWESPRASFDGKYVNLRDAECYPKPIQQPVPIYVAGPSSAALERSAQRAEGWIDSHLLPQQLVEAKAYIDDHRRNGGRADGEFTIARQFYVSLSDTFGSALNTVREATNGASRQETVTDSQGRRIIGTPDDVVQTIGPYLDAGVSEVCVIFYAKSLNQVVHQAELFASKVVPQLTMTK